VLDGAESEPVFVLKERKLNFLGSYIYIYIYIYLKLERSRVFSFFLLGFSNFRSVFGGIIFVRVIILRGSSCVVHIVWLLWCLLGVKN
jgi:hypothetical protein